jgi:hypothetical protein
MVDTRRNQRSSFLLLALVVGTLEACTESAKDPFSPPSCQQLPSDAVQQTADRLAAAPDEAERTGLEGAESGVIPPTRATAFAYHCRWRSTDPGAHVLALEVTVDQGEAATIAIRTEGMKRHAGPALAAPVPGEGRAWTEKGVGVASWVCRVPPDPYATTPYVEVRVFFPKHASDPALDAKTLAEAIIPLIGCTPGKATPTPSGPTPTGPDTVPPSSTPSR